MPSKSSAQKRFMAAACNSKQFRKKHNISKKAACEYHRKDKKKK